jgi:methionyl-tRNA formyltransferase
MKTSYNIVFMGTPAFAVPSLTALHHSRHTVIHVVTQPDRPSGRGRKIGSPPVKTAARAFGYPVVQPAKIKTDAFVETLTNWQPDMLVVAAYGHILPKTVLEIPSAGCVNVHGSILPKYRGAAPIQWAIINGEKETGITTMLMDVGMDTGDILLTAKESIRPEDTAATLHDRLAVLGADLLIDTLNRLADGRLKATPQDHSQATVAPMLKKEDGRIDWTQATDAICNRIRGVTPWPGAFTFIGDRRLKIYSAVPASSAAAAAPGTVVAGFADELRVAAGSGTLSVLEVQGESGKRMTIKKFLHGHPIAPGTVLE